MTVSEYIFDFLQKKGLDTVFMVSGSSSMWLTDALIRNESLKSICCHHEQAAAMAADGYGRINNKPGACLVTIGPGATNAITGVAQAFLDSSPMFVISGQANSRLLQYEIDTKIRQQGTQSLNLEPIVSPITKYFHALMNPDDIIEVMNSAYHSCMNGRKGPVWIDVPVDIQNRQISHELLDVERESLNSLSEVNVSPIKNDIIYNKKIKELVSLIKQSEKPLILAGYGVRSANAVSELKQVSLLASIPIVTSRGGIDVIESDYPLFIGRPGSYGDRASHFAIQEADLLLILGSRLSVSTIGYYPERFGQHAKKIMVDIDRKELDKTDVPVDEKIHCNLFEFLTELLHELKQEEFIQKKDNWTQHCISNRSKFPTVLPEYYNQIPLNEYYVTSIISKECSNQSNIIVDTGSVCNIVSQSWQLKKGQRYIISGGLSCMGFWATAIGTCQTSRDVIAIAGDGSVQMNIQEFATLQYNQLPIKLFVYNNNGYMLIRHNQHNYMNDRFLGVGPDSGLQTPDFCKVAQAYGLKALRIEAGDDIQQKVKSVLEIKEPVVCEVMCQEFSPIIPRIASKVMPDGSLKAAEFDDLYPFMENMC